MKTTETEMWSDMAERGLVAVDREHYESLKKQASAMLMMLKEIRDLTPDDEGDTILFAETGIMDNIKTVIAKAERQITACPSKKIPNKK